MCTCDKRPTYYVFMGMCALLGTCSSGLFRRKMKRERDHKAMLSNFVLCNLCIALACGLLVFLVGIEGALSIDVS